MSVSEIGDAEGQVDVVLLCMPFGPQVLQPSLGLSLLKPTLEPLGISCRILYFTLKFAQKIGFPIYSDIAYTEPTTHGFAGEWLFNGALFPDHPHDVEGYVNEILRGESAGYQEARDNLRPVADKVIEDILAVRSQVAPFIEECLQQVLALRPKVVGFTSTFQQQVASLAMARRIKEAAPEIRTVFGGANCEGTMGAEVVRQFSFVDAAVSGEGDMVFPQLIERMILGQSYDDLAGVNTRRNCEATISGSRPAGAPMMKDMDALPFPDFTDFFEQFEATDLGLDKEVMRPRLMFETSRGCWWGEKAHCTFCGLNGGTMSFRSKSESRALQELVYFHERYPDCAVSVTDNILDMKYFQNFVPELVERKMGLELFYEVKSNLRKDQVKLMKEAGITLIQPGVESLSDQVLGLMRKGVRGLQNLQLLKWCKEYGVVPSWNWLWGFPGEDPEEYARMAERIPLFSHLPPPGGGGIIRLDRFSPNFERAEEFGFVQVAPYPAYFYMYPGVEPEAVARLAYFFTYRFRETRDIKGYTAPVRNGIVSWREEHESSALFYIDKGERLLVWDLRPTAPRPLTVLEGLARQVYVACDAICSSARLAEMVNEKTGHSLTAAEVEELLKPLEELGLIIHDGSSWLALALPLGDYSPKAKVMQRFQEKVKELGQVSLNRYKVELPLAALKPVAAEAQVAFSA